MTSPIPNLDPIAEEIRAHLAEKHRAREEGLPKCREAIRYCANSIRAIHRLEFNEARDLMVQARACLDQAKSALEDHPDVFHVGFVHDSQKEYAEAAITLALASGGGLPNPEELGVHSAAYLNGLAEAASEMRRHILDTLRRDDIQRCEELLGHMDEIYSVLITIDYPDAITGGLRRTTDMLRGVLERTRGDLTVAYRQSQLESQLKTVRESLEGPTSCS